MHLGTHLEWVRMGTIALGPPLPRCCDRQRMSGRYPVRRTEHSGSAGGGPAASLAAVGGDLRDGLGPKLRLDRAAILTTVARAEYLPPFPRVVADVERELGRKEPSRDRVAASVEQDPALSAGVLRFANSALFSARSEVASVSQAIGRLGFREIRRIAVTAGVMGLWQPMPGINLERFWSHSVAVGLMSAELAKRLGSRLDDHAQEAAFSAGLLHDLGALLLACAFPEQVLELRRDLGKTGGHIADMELNRWGIDHGEVAGQLAQRWKLPAPLRESMCFHHRPWLAAERHHTLVQVVHVADYFCTNQGFSRDTDQQEVWFDATSWERLGLDLDDALAIFDSATEQGNNSRIWIGALSQMSTPPEVRSAGRA